MKYIIYIFLMIFSWKVEGQNFDYMDISFDKGGQKLLFPGTGGIKNPLFSNIDLNGDGIKDLFVFDKEGSTILTFLHTGEPGKIDFRYAPEYESVFPKLQTFALLVDFNKDGVEDIFTEGFISGTMEVYRGKRVNNTLQFELVTFGFPGSIGNFLQVFISGYTQIYNSPIDIPAIVDVDDDGDIDILSFQAGSDKLSYYQNRSVEENLPIDSLKFVLNTACWGGFKENELSADVNISTGPDDCFNLHIPDKGEVRHSGSTSLILDIDGDGDKDLLLGDLTNPHLKLLKNGGTKNKAWINEIDHTFPSYDVPVDLQVFIAASYADVNNDGKRDLIITPNDRSDSEKQNHIWLYLNKGSDLFPDFRLETKTFLVDQTISLGSGSHPCFLDYNQDGLIDLLIGGNGNIDYDGKKSTWLELYKNTGSLTEPRFSLEDDDYLGFKNFVNAEIRLAPTGGDLDGDGDIDILVGTFNAGQLHYFKNNAGKGNPFTFEPRVFPFLGLSPGFNSKPCITDFNEDGLNDLIIGELSTELNYFQNIGTLLDPQFNILVNMPPNTRNLGKIFSQQGDYFSESGAPLFFEDKTGKKMLFGNQGGGIRLFDIKDNNPLSAFILLDDRIGDISCGSRTVPSLYDIDNDGYLEIVIGNERGGICFYNTTFEKKTVSTTEVTNNVSKALIFPNPGTGVFYLNSANASEIKIFNIQGNEIPAIQEGNMFSIISPEPGIYIIRITSENTFFYEKLIVTD